MGRQNEQGHPTAKVRSTELCALVTSIKHKYKGVFFFRASCCSCRTTNIMSTVERGTLFLRQNILAFAVSH